MTVSLLGFEFPNPFVDPRLTPSAILLYLMVSTTFTFAGTYLATVVMNWLMERQPHHPPGYRLHRELGFPLLLLALFAMNLYQVPRIAALRLPGHRPPDWLGFALSIGAIIGLGILLMRVVHAVFLRLYERYDISRNADNLRQRRIRTQLQFTEKILALLLTFLTVATVLLSFEEGRRVGTSLLASAGVASVVLGFAAQRSLSNLVAGFQIAFTQPIRLDDAIVVENEWGWVEEISLTYVVVRLWDRRRLVLPITYFVEKPFQNWTRTNAQVLGAVHLRLDFSAPIDAIEQELFRLLDSTPLWDRDVRVLQLVETHERSIELRALMSAQNSPTAFDLRCHVRRGLVEFLQQHHPYCLPSVRVDFDSAYAAPDSVRTTRDSLVAASAR